MHNCPTCGGLLGRRIGWQGVASCMACGRDFDVWPRSEIVVCGERPYANDPTNARLMDESEHEELDLAA